jgi:MOSC domain-containing protein YiiM
VCLFSHEVLQTLQQEGH